MEPVTNPTNALRDPNAPLAGREIPTCEKCRAPMTEVYELDVPIIENNADTQRRDKQYGYACPACYTAAWSLNGKTQEHTAPKVVEVKDKKGKKGAPTILPQVPLQAHPRMQEVLAKTLKAFRAAE